MGGWDVAGKGKLVVGNASVTVTLASRLVFLPLVMRDFPPIPVGKLLRINGGAAYTYQVTATLEVSATVQADYIEWMRFSNDNIHWSDWAYLRSDCDLEAHFQQWPGNGVCAVQGALGRNFGCHI